jgi:very-short-patch-repair endonuclease
MMARKRITSRQRIDGRKRALAREMRRNMTPAELRLWQHLRRNQLGGWHFRRQQIIAGFIVDFYCAKAYLVVEVDGEIHSQSTAADTERENILNGLGLTVIRFSNDAVLKDTFGVLDAIRRALLDSSWQQKAPPSM